MNLGRRQDDEVANQAREVARNTTDDPVMQRYIEGAAYKIITLENDVKTLKTNYWILIFVIFVFPILARLAA